MSVGAWISTHRMVCVDIRLGHDIYTAKHRMVAECRLSWQLGTECWGHALHVVTPGVTLGWQWGATNTLSTSFVLLISTFRYWSNHIVKNCTCQCLFKPFGFSHQKCSVLKKIYHRHPLIWNWYRFWRHNAIEKIMYSGLSFVLCPLS